MARSGVLLFAACDGAFHEQFGRAFVLSAIASGNRVHLHLINPAPDTRRIDHPAVTYSEEAGAPVNRAWYAACRFMRAPLVYRSQPQPHDRLLILDADSIVRRRLDPPDVPVGLFLRDTTGRAPEAIEHSRVMAGLALMGPGGEIFFDALARRLGAATDWDWYVDQLALAQTMDALAGRAAIHDFGQDPGWMDWTFSADSAVWTAKGPRKFEDPTYLAELARWSEPATP
ncbi:MAG: hypothetical protein EON88_07880 [Brevundimonas sp.]|nr:MAG: hypothetical protein EON88_07880 [Brevundimonas sp.]